MKIESIRKNEDVLCCFREINVKEGCRLVWAITTKCNLNCCHCFVDSKDSKKELSTNEAFQIINQLRALNIKKVLFTGGEPLMRSDIFELIKECVNKGIHVDLNTNATLINEKIAQKLKKIGLKEITTSIDGATSKIHEEIRRVKGCFEKTIKSIKILKSLNFKVDIVTVVNKINKKEIGKIIDLAYTFKADSITISVLILRGKALKNIERLRLFSTDFSDIRDLIFKKRQQFLTFPIRTLGMPWGILKQCEAGKNILYLDSTGNIHPCPWLLNNFFIETKRKKVKKECPIHNLI